MVHSNRPSSNRRAIQASDDLVRNGRDHLDQRKGISDLDLTDLRAFHACLTRDGPEKVAWPHAVFFPHGDE